MATFWSWTTARPVPPTGLGVPLRSALWFRVAVFGALDLLLAIFILVIESADWLSHTPATQLGAPGVSWTVGKAATFVILSLVGGSIGGTLQGVASLTAHVGAGDFDPSRTTWYLTQAIVGTAVAAVYLVALNAVLGGQSWSGAMRYGARAVAMLSGLFSRHALDKLEHIFDGAFASLQMATDGTGMPRIERITPQTRHGRRCRRPHRGGRDELHRGQLVRAGGIAGPTSAAGRHDDRTRAASLGEEAARTGRLSGPDTDRNLFDGAELVVQGES